MAAPGRRRRRRLAEFAASASAIADGRRHTEPELEAAHALVEQHPGTALGPGATRARLAHQPRRARPVDEVQHGQVGTQQLGGNRRLVAAACRSAWRSPRGPRAQVRSAMWLHVPSRRTMKRCQSAPCRLQREPSTRGRSAGTEDDCARPRCRDRAARSRRSGPAGPCCGRSGAARTRTIVLTARHSLGVRGALVDEHRRRELVRRRDVGTADASSRSASMAAGRPSAGRSASS